MPPGGLLQPCYSQMEISWVNCHISHLYVVIFCRSVRNLLVRPLPLQKMTNNSKKSWRRSKNGRAATSSQSLCPSTCFPLDAGSVFLFIPPSGWSKTFRPPKQLRFSSSTMMSLFQHQKMKRMSQMMTVMRKKRLMVQEEARSLLWELLVSLLKIMLRVSAWHWESSVMHIQCLFNFSGSAARPKSRVGSAASIRRSAYGNRQSRLYDESFEARDDGYFTRTPEDEPDTPPSRTGFKAGAVRSLRSPSPVMLRSPEGSRQSSASSSGRLSGKIRLVCCLPCRWTLLKQL